MNLKVPLVIQPKNSVDCGVACVAMLLAYHGVPYDYKELRRDIGLHKWGTASPQLGLWLLEQGFDVEIVTMHPSLFSLHGRPRGRAAMLKHLKLLKKFRKTSDSKLVLDYFIKFVEAGGLLTPKVPEPADVREEIVSGRPVIALLTHWFLHDMKLPPRFTFHYNVITGLDDRRVTVNDPDWGAAGGRSRHLLRDYFYAIHASAFGELDNACLIKVGPRTRAV